MLEDREVAEANAPRGLPHDDGLAVVGEAEARGGDHLQVVCAVAARDRLGERGAVDLGEHLERTPLAIGIKDLPARRGTKLVVDLFFERELPQGRGRRP